MADPVGQVARAVAEQLAAGHGPALVTEVEAELHARDGAGPANRYVDPVSLASLIVAVAALAWTVYRDLRKQTPTPSSDVVARSVRVQLRERHRTPTAERDQIVDIVVSETTRLARTDDTP
jgi:hypothetical protein